MVLTIFLCIVGLISGMGIYSALGLDDLLIIAPLIGGVIGIILGIALDKVMVTLKKEENKTTSDDKK